LHGHTLSSVQKTGENAKVTDTLDRLEAPESEKKLKLRYRPKGRKARKAARLAVEKAKQAKPKTAPKTEAARLLIRPYVEAHKAIPRQQLMTECGVSAQPFKTAEQREYGRFEGLLEAAQATNGGKKSGLVSLDELKSELAPIIEAMKREGVKDPVCIAPMVILKAANALSTLVWKWSH
jgi:hypothetical protein